ncbi:MAG TPA: DUF4127 family protein [Deinococcales bacterium]|nr:DUF4127 family protein [Deinococcales bacterium]
MKALLLPCDTRPPTLEAPVQAARCAGVTLETPPREILNDLNRPGDPAALAEWLRERAPEAEFAVLTLETLALGGMIPARRVDDPLETALERLEVLREVKRANPRLRLLAYGVIVRVAHDNDPLEEKPYYGQFGPQLRTVSEWTDRAERTGRPQDAATLEAAREAVPAPILENWLGTRERNHALHRRAIEMLAEGTLEHLCLTLDDTTPYGLAARDRRRLEALLDAGNLWDRADVYPGADEVATALVARALVNARPEGALPVRVVYPSTLAEASVMLYEDRCLGELVKAHLRAAGCRPARPGETPAFTLAVNAPAARQGQRAPDFETVDTANRNLPEFLDELAAVQSAGQPLAVADVAYANGSDPRFTTQLLARLDVTRLLAYGAWNTAGNALGGAIGLAACAALGANATPETRRARVEAVLARLVDDHLYQGAARAEVWDVLDDPSPFDLGGQLAAAEAEVAARMIPRAQALWNAHFAPRLPGWTLETGRPGLAWPRLFTGVFPLKVTAPAGE